MIRVLRILLRIVLGIFGGAVLYALIAVVLSHISVDAEADGGSDVTAYILSNGVHTDIVVPVRTAERDWSRSVPFANTTGKDTTAQWIAFGWGDKGFYLETPTWGDLTFPVAFKAMFALGNSAMHVTYHHALKEDSLCKRIHLSGAQYQRLITYIERSFALDEQGNTQAIVTKAVYGSNDAFYEGVGRYHLFHTCNSWANGALKACGQKACLWTATDGAILDRYE